MAVDPLVGVDNLLRSSVLEGVTDVFMSTAGRMSLVDLTSPHIDSQSFNVWGANDGLSIFWAGSSNDSFMGQGGDALIFGGAGFNVYSLDAGREVLQYRAGVDSIDLVYNSNWAIDVIELWKPASSVATLPKISYGDNLLSFEWESSVVDFVLGDFGVPAEINIEYMNAA